MKQFFLTCIIILLTVPQLSSFSQDNNYKCYFNEFNVSFNRSHLNKDGHESRNGIGLGAYHLMRVAYRLNPILGIEFNQLAFYKEKGHFGHFYSESDLEIKPVYATLISKLRYTFFNNVKPFMEGGGSFSFQIQDLSNATVLVCKPPLAPADSGLYSCSSYKKKISYRTPVRLEVLAGFGIMYTKNYVELFLRFDYSVPLLPTDISVDYFTYARIVLGIAFH